MDIVVLADPAQPPPEACMAALELAWSGLGALTRVEHGATPPSALAGALHPWRRWRLDAPADPMADPVTLPSRIEAAFVPLIGRCALTVAADEAAQATQAETPSRTRPDQAAALAAFSTGCLVRRKAAPQLAQTTRQAFRHIGVTPPAASLRACDSIAEELDRVAAHGPEPRYHNRHHIADTILATASLLRVALGQGWLDPHDATLCIVAMTGHDLHHDGTINRPDHHLETIAARAVAAIMRDGRCPEADIAMVRELILATDPKHQNGLRQRKLTHGLTRLEMMFLLAGDADLFASLLPGIGEQLSIDLAEEWRAARISFPAMPDTPKGRRGFLSFVTAMSEAAEAIGVPAIVQDQLAQLPP